MGSVSRSVPQLTSSMLMSDVWRLLGRMLTSLNIIRSLFINTFRHVSTSNQNGVVHLAQDNNSHKVNCILLTTLFYNLWHVVLLSTWKAQALAAHLQSHAMLKPQDLIGRCKAVVRQRTHHSRSEWGAVWAEGQWGHCFKICGPLGWS